ncbi:MAG TPA: DUF4199 domain-containing protein [Puia sp.]|jgi:hypothetical protein|nr:DUF4199 domain-containing protein [Puia sp.]
MPAKKISIAFIFGLIAAAAVSLFILFLYFAGPKAFVGGIAFLSYIIVIVMGAAAALVQKRANDGWLPFHEAVKVCFTVFVLGLAARTLFPWLLVNFIDPHFKQRLLPEILAGAERSYRSLGVAEDQIRQQIEAIRTQDNFALSSLLMGLAFSYIVFFIIALVIAAIVKRKRPEPASKPGMRAAGAGDPKTTGTAGPEL